jgi:hypothetical protein
MDEHEFDALMPSHTFGLEDAKRADVQMRRRMALGLALWGRTSEDLQRQLLADHPQIPSGFALADFLELQQNAETIAASLIDPSKAWLSRLPLSSGTILVGTQNLTAWEARCEIVRRAIAYLEGR